MSDLKYTVDVDARRGRNSLQQLQRQVSGTEAAFGRLRGIIGTFAIGAVIRSSANLANQFNDLSAATDISVRKLVGFSQAVQQNGGTLQTGQQFVAQFTDRMGRAAAGATDLQKAFGQLGISVQDLQTLSPDQLFTRAVSALGDLESQADRTAIGVRLFSEAFTRIDFPGVSANMGRLTSEAAKTEKAMREVGQANQALTNFIEQFKIALVPALEPLARLLNSLNENREAVADFTRLLIELGKVFLFLKGFRLLAGDVNKTGSAAKSASGPINSVGTALGALFLFGGQAKAGMLRFIPAVAKAVLVFEGLHFALKQIFDFDLKAWADSAAAELENFVESVAPGLADSINELGEALGMAPAPSQKPLNEIREQHSKILDLMTQGTMASRDQTAQLGLSAEAAKKQREEAEKLLNFRRELEDSAAATIRSAEEEFDAFRRRFELQTELIGLEDRQALKVTTMAEFREQHLARVREIENEINSIRLDGSKEQQERLTKLVETQQRLQDIGQRNMPVMEEMIEARQRALDAAERQREADRASAEALSVARREAEQLAVARQRVTESVGEFGQSAEDRIREQRQAAELDGLSGIQRRLREIEIQEQRVARAARDRVREQLGENDPELLKQSLEEIDQISQDITQRRLGAEQQIFREQREFSTGWQRAFREYEDAATNSSLQAERIFQQTTQGMEDSIVNFAKTGKFEWRGFVSTILEELLRNNVRQLISQTFGAVGLGGGSGGGGGGGSLFGGFFATGGMIPPGRFGVVGESGPELVQGPAQVTPQGTQQVVYNINAVDATSFQNLLARDPELIYALTEQGRRRIPQTRRR